MSRHSSNIFVSPEIQMVHFLHLTSLVLILHVVGAVANTIPREYDDGSSHVGTSMFGRKNCPSGSSKLYDIQLTDSPVHPVYRAVP